MYTDKGGILIDLIEARDNYIEALNVDCLCTCKTLSLNNGDCCCGRKELIDDTRERLFTLIEELLDTKEINK